jgi:hypothetical protein
VYVVADTGIGGLFGQTELGRALNESSTHSAMLYACEVSREAIQKKLYNVEGFNINNYVCDHSETGVGGFSAAYGEGFANNEWIPIFKVARQSR